MPSGGSTGFGVAFSLVGANKLAGLSAFAAVDLSFRTRAGRMQKTGTSNIRSFALEEMLAFLLARLLMTMTTEDESAFSHHQAPRLDLPL